MDIHKSMLAVFAILKIARRLPGNRLSARENPTETTRLEQVLKTIENQDCKHAYILATYTCWNSVNCWLVVRLMKGDELMVYTSLSSKAGSTYQLNIAHLRKPHEYLRGQWKHPHAQVCG